MNPLADACRNPFSNGTERYAWTAVWCDYCAHDHEVSHGAALAGPGCDILMEYDAYCGTDEWRWPEAWLPEPDDGKFCLPSRMTCGQFKPCHEGECAGDPHPETRAAIVAEVTAYWVDRRARSNAPRSLSCVQSTQRAKERAMSQGDER